MSTYVTTFYSFKGGVGRTTLLVNIAYLLAERGERVLIWDLDVEAPGVHHFPGLAPPDQIWQGGFLEWLGDTPACPTPQPSPAWPADAWMATLCDRVYQSQEVGDGSILVLPAHGTDANLGREYAAVDWHALFVQEPEQGLHLLRRVSDALTARFEPTFLLIDSRTGISDLGGLITGFLPDCTVLVGNYGVQSTVGLRGVYLALDRFATERVHAEPHRHRKLDRLLVASPVPVALPERQRGRDRWSGGFPGVAPRSLIEIPLVETLLYTEDVLVRTAPSSDAARAYLEVASQLIALRTSQARDHRAELPFGAESDAKVKQLLRLLGFELSLSKHGELIAHERSALDERSHRVIYLPITARANPALRDELDRLLSSNDSPAVRPLIIVDDAHDDARWAADARGITLRTVTELEDQLVDRRAYLATVQRTFENSELARTYVTPDFRLHGQRTNALTHATKWARGVGPRLLLIVGDPGSGKTTFVRRLAYEIATLETSETEPPMPVVIDLAHAGLGSTLASTLQQHFQTMIGWHGHPDALLYLLHAGKMILFFDGFDEMPASQTTTTVNRLRWLTWGTARHDLPATANRMLVTMRPDVDSAADTMEAMITWTDVEVAAVAPFDAPQMISLLASTVGHKTAKRVYAQLRDRKDVALLASNPLLLQLFAECAVRGSRPLNHVTPASLYEQHFTPWIDRGSASGILSREQRWAVLERIAMLIWPLGDPGIPIAWLVDVLATELPPFDPIQLDDELKAAPFLLRFPEGWLRFAHRGFLEYFIARHIARCAGLGAESLHEPLATSILSTACAALVAELIAQVPRAKNAIQDVARGNGRFGPVASENAMRIIAALHELGAGAEHLDA